MLQLLSSYWLWALTGLLVPVLIHLWNKKQPKVIKVGSIRWLQAAASQQARRLQLNDWPLLLLRCLLLASLVLFICGPVWQRLVRSKSQKYVWVAPSLLQPQTLPLVQTTIDSLIKNNYQFRAFASDFQPVFAESWTNLKAGKEEMHKPEGNINYWTLAKAIHQQFPQAQEHLLITDNQFTHFAGPRPILPASSRWLTIPVNQNDSLFVQEVFQNSPDSLTVIVGKAETAGTRFSRFSFSTPAHGQALTPTGLPQIAFSQEEDQKFISFQNNSERVPVREPKKNITLFYDKSRRQDVGYLRAALAAVSDYTGRPLHLSQVTSFRQVNANTNWLFWLSDQPLPAPIQAEIKKGLILFKDAATTNKTALANSITTGQLPENIVLTKQVRMEEKEGSSVWQNNFGEPVLQFKAVGQGGIYTFGSRFNAQWNNLPESSFFPELLSYIIFPAAKIRHDYRELDNDQAQPILAKTRPQQTFRSQVQRDLKYWFLAFGALLFLMERVWAFRKGRRQI